MRRLGLALVVLGIGVLMPAQPSAAAEENARARRLLEVTHADGLLDQLLPAILAQQSALLRQSHPGVSQPTLQAFRAELRQALEAAGDAFLDRMSQLYAEAFSAAEIDELIGFYETPVGRKSVALMPQLIQAAIEVGRDWSAPIGERIRTGYQN